MRQRDVVGTRQVASIDILPQSFLIFQGQIYILMFLGFFVGGRSWHDGTGGVVSSAVPWAERYQEVRAGVFRIGEGSLRRNGKCVVR